MTEAVEDSDVRHRPASLRHRWLVTDLDGTIVGRDLRLVESSRLAVRRYRDAGGVVVVATGRNEDSAGPYHRQLGLDTPLILYNGARVVQPDGEVLLDRHLGDAWPTLRSEVVARLPDDTGAVAFLGRRPVVVKDAPALAEYARRDGITLEHRPVPTRARVTKLMLVCAVPRLVEPARQVAELAPRLTVVQSEDTYLEVLPEGASKGSALRWLAEREGVDLAQVAAIGDNPNDLDLLAVAGLGAAVGDGHPRLLEQADLVVRPCAEGAVADLVDQLLAQEAEAPDPAA